MVQSARELCVDEASKRICVSCSAETCRTCSVANVRKSLVYPMRVGAVGVMGGSGFKERVVFPLTMSMGGARGSAGRVVSTSSRGVRASHGTNTIAIALQATPPSVVEKEMQTIKRRIAQHRDAAAKDTGNAAGMQLRIGALQARLTALRASTSLRTAKRGSQRVYIELKIKGRKRVPVHVAVGPTTLAIDTQFANGSWNHDRVIRQDVGLSDGLVHVLAFVVSSKGVAVYWDNTPMDIRLFTEEERGRFHAPVLVFGPMSVDKRFHGDVLVHHLVTMPTHDPASTAVTLMLQRAARSRPRKSAWLIHPMRKGPTGEIQPVRLDATILATLRVLLAKFGGSATGTVSDVEKPHNLGPWVEWEVRFATEEGKVKFIACAGIPGWLADPSRLGVEFKYINS